VKQKLEIAGVSANVIGEVTSSPEIEVFVDGNLHLKEKNFGSQGSVGGNKLPA
jgi:phosphoribosylformylglycinamidine synthase